MLYQNQSLLILQQLKELLLQQSMNKILDENGNLNSLYKVEDYGDYLLRIGQVEEQKYNENMKKSGDFARFSTKKPRASRFRLARGIKRQR